LRILRILLRWKEELKMSVVQMPKNIAEKSAIIDIETESSSFISLAKIEVIIPIKYVKEIIVVRDIIVRCF